MGSTITSLILAVYIIFQCVNCEKMVIETIPGPIKIEPNSGPIPTAGYMIQQVTPKIKYVGQMFYYSNKSELLFPNRETNGSIYVWFEKNGTTKAHYFKELAKETIATIVPVSETRDKFIVGSNRNLRLVTKNYTDYSISEPLIQFDPGFIIYSAHCNSKGTMIILLIGTNPENRDVGKFYKVANKKSKLLATVYNRPRDFGFHIQYNSLYVVHDHGKKISQYKYDNTTGELEKKVEVFDLNIYPEYKNNILTSVVNDRNSGYLWVSAAGSEGYIFKVNPSTKKIVELTTLPTKDLTFLTFGYTDHKTMFVGSKRTCVKTPVEGTIYGITGAVAQGVPDNPIKW